MEGLNLIDRKILYELDCNSRQTIARLAKKLRLGRVRVKYRMGLLEKKGIIQKYTTATNLYKIGLTIYKTYLKLENNRQRINEFLEFLRAHPSVYWVAECDGVWDFIFSAFAKSSKEFYEMQDKILSEFNDIIIEFNVYTLVDVLLFRKNYFLNKGSDHFSFGGYPESNVIDKIDYKILKLLSENARANVVDLARKLSTTATVVKHRIKKLEKLGIIVGYRIDVDLEKIGMTFFKAQLYLRKHDRQLEKQFREYCKFNPNITYYIQQLGNCKLELELGAKDYKQFNEIMGDIKEKFAKFIKNIDATLIRREYFKWVPGEL